MGHVCLVKVHAGTFPTKKRSIVYKFVLLSESCLVHITQQDGRTFVIIMSCMLHTQFLRSSSQQILSNNSISWIDVNALQYFFYTSVSIFFSLSYTHFLPLTFSYSLKAVPSNLRNRKSFGLPALM